MKLAVPAAVAMVALTTGCGAMFTTWTPIDSTDRFEIDHTRPPLIRRDGDTCRSIPYAHTVHEIREHRGMSTLAKVVSAIGLGGVLGSLAQVQTVDGPYCTRYECTSGPHLAYTPTGEAMVAVGSVLALAPLLVWTTQRGTRVRDEIDPAEPDVLVPAAADDVPCSDAATAGRTP